VKSDVTTVSPTRVKITVEVPVEELQPSIDAAFRTIAKQVNVPGFRKGKVPARIIEQRFGRAAVLEEAVNEALPKAYDEAIRTNGIQPIGRPEIDVTELADNEALTFTAEVDVRPEFDVPEYTGLQVEVASATPTDDDVQTQLDGLRTRFASLREVERPAADGDVLLVDISGATDAGDPVEDLSGDSMSYELGTDGMLPGFDEAVRGAVAGEEREFDFTPQNGDWTGERLIVTATVRAVRERDLPAADDDFAQFASEFDTIEELREDLRTRLVRGKKLEQGAEARRNVLQALLDSVDIPLPENIIAAEVEAHFEDGHEGSDEHRAEVEKEARESLKSQFVLDKIAEAEEVTVGETDLSVWLFQQAPRYGMSPDALAQALVEAGQVPMAIQDIRRGKALALVMQTASVVDADGEVVDLAALDAELGRGPVLEEVDEITVTEEVVVDEDGNVVEVVETIEESVEVVEIVPESVGSADVVEES